MAFPDTTWHAAHQHTTDPDELTTLGVHAHHVAPAIAEIFYRQAADAGLTGAMLDLGNLLADAGRVDEAEHFYRQAADAGLTGAMLNLGVLREAQAECTGEGGSDVSAGRE